MEFSILAKKDSKCFGQFEHTISAIGTNLLTAISTLRRDIAGKADRPVFRKRRRLTQDKQIYGTWETKENYKIQTDRHIKLEDRDKIWKQWDWKDDTWLVTKLKK